MGVPKFFRYTSERYPCLNELVKQYQIPDFDHMYLDMNGIIHNCSHPDDSNPHFRITEEKIFEDVFHYISILFQIIKPKKLFFMAIDGVAPRAKMNQQRGRRFRSAREAERLEEEAKAKGETLPSEKRFDSNCITPGTVFMARLHEQLRFFVKKKITTDPLWSKVKVVLSGHETPGEGEHKIMDYIRWARSQPEYDPNTRHCLYGLDADLIMLGMCTHEPHFALLREEVKFGKNSQRVTSPEETNFYLLHLSLLKEYLEQEFIAIKNNLPFPFDIEKIVDDWVMMGFLVGNDFIPHLPNMHIGNDAVPLLYKTYMKVLPTLSGYINEAGELNLERFEIFMQELAKIDREMFQETFVDLQYFEAKTGRRPNANERKEYKPNNDETFNVNVAEIKTQMNDDLQALINATDEMFLDDDDAYDGDSSEEGGIGDVEAEFKLHKRDYYMTKLDYSSVTEEVLADQAEGYVRAIQWNLYYYYKGCPSWCWYYPHHYAPYMSDIKGFKNLKIDFELGDPFKPFEQLLAVLPAASKHLLPTPFHDLMTDQDSAIVHYYPVTFETDLNGKINDWEAVVLIPFIDETNLLSAMAPCYQRLTEEELKRNTHGPMLVYNWVAADQGPAIAPEYFPLIEKCHALELFVWRKDLEVSASQLRKGVLPNARTDMLYPGFPTMRHLKYQTSLKNAKVRVFEQPSRNISMMVEILNSEDPSLEAVAKELLGKTIWVGWPHLTRAKVMSVSNEKMRLHHVDQQNNNINSEPSYTTQINAGALHQQWISERSTVVEHNLNRLGIELGSVQILIHAVNHKGYKYIVQDNSKMAIEPEFCTVPCGYALQATVKDVSAYIMEDVGRFSTPQEAYPPGEQVFLITQGQYYGCQATVVDSEAIRSGRIKVTLSERDEPIPVANSSASPYHNANHAAAACGISSHMLARITGVVLLGIGERNDLPFENQNKTNIGLNLKLNKKNLEVSGYTRKCKVTNAWLYSRRCVELVKLYAQTYPELFDKLTYVNFNDMIFESDIWPGESGHKKASEIATWLKTLPHAKALRRECGSECLEPEEMKALAECMDQQLRDLSMSDKKVSLQVKWNLLYKPELFQGNIQPDPKADYKIYDRVVCVARNITVPFGAKGTVTAVHPAPNANTVRLSDKLNADASYQVLFDEPFPGAMIEEGFDTARFYRMQTTHLLNISFGRKLRDLVTTVKKNNQDSLGFTYNQPTNILRRGDGLNSAFASYSPPIDKKISPFENRNNNSNMTPISIMNAAPTPLVPDKNGLQPDNATHLLKSLLKISENETDTKKNKVRSKNVNTQERNWRVKETNIADLPPPPQPQQTRIQQPTNWRKEQLEQSNDAKSQSNAAPQEWTNTNYKIQSSAPMPPFPTFGAMPAQGPVPTQIPFPQFQNPHFQRTHDKNPRSQPNQSRDSRPQGHGKSMNQAFPKHLPAVGGNSVTLGPSWMAQNSKPTAAAAPPGTSKPLNTGQSSADKLSNPFVPLQVQTSRRRIQNTSGPATKKDTGEVVVPQYVLPNTEPQTIPIDSQQPLVSKPSKKKKKPRIAANLPFQMD